ncbi:hypothetical protein AWB76_00203 [Caballeronia temeraria]|uniref:Uncharacterized protein n=1 Tax=Caballeronia temeraria TaxID=1777137 RepID=A0A157Z5N4_9BURK|nr:hypothetical protein [Caballeronia temeraria]SAK40733.1 hypothetical protein AWB76_00203 [Caballeronia temeraria]
MKKPASRLRGPLPELVMDDPNGGEPLRTGLTLIDVRTRETLQRLDVALMEGFTAAYQADADTAFVLDMRRRNSAIVKALFDGIEGELREGFGRVLTRHRQSQQGYSGDIIARARDLWIAEYHRRAATGRTVTKAQLFRKLKTELRMGETKAREVVADIPWPPPKSESRT